VVDPVVVELGNVEDVIGGIINGIYNRIRNDLLPDDGKERVFADVGDHHSVDLAAALEDAEDGDLAGCAAPAFAFANAAKIAFVHFDKPLDWQAVLQLRSDDLTEPMKEIGGCLAIDARQIRRAPSCHSSDKKLSQPILRLFLQTTTPYRHTPILDPLRIWDSS
jgi:hypothetical protein